MIQTRVRVSQPTPGCVLFYRVRGREITGHIEAQSLHEARSRLLCRSSAEEIMSAASYELGTPRRLPPATCLSCGQRPRISVRKKRCKVCDDRKNMEAKWNRASVRKRSLAPD